MSMMARNEGVMSLYRGLLSPVMGYGLIKGTAFWSYATFKSFLTTSGWNKDRRMCTTPHMFRSHTVM